MAATTVQRRPKWLGEHCTRHGVNNILRGTKWEAGWLIASHDDRLMAYPDGGFDNATTAINGGPLQVPGADANGGLRLIAKRRSITFALVNGTLGLSVAYNNIVLTCHRPLQMQPSSTYWNAHLCMSWQMLQSPAPARV